LQGYVELGIVAPEEPPPLDELPLEEPPLGEAPLDELAPDEEPESDPGCESDVSTALPPHPEAGNAPRVARNDAHQRSNGVRKRMTGSQSKIRSHRIAPRFARLQKAPGTTWHKERR
jgi:hypothetical protein